MRSKMGCLEAFENGVPMLRGGSAPFLNALEDKPQVCFFKTQFCSDQEVSPGENTFFFLFKWLHLEQKKGAFLNPINGISKKLLPTSFCFQYLSPLAVLILSVEK